MFSYRFFVDTDETDVDAVSVLAELDVREKCNVEPVELRATLHGPGSRKLTRWRIDFTSVQAASPLSFSPLGLKSTKETIQ
jgi:hypothetical protein